MKKKGLARSVTRRYRTTSTLLNKKHETPTGLFTVMSFWASLIAQLEEELEDPRGRPDLGPPTMLKPWLGAPKGRVASC